MLNMNFFPLNPAIVLRYVIGINIRLNISRLMTMNLNVSVNSHIEECFLTALDVKMGLIFITYPWLFRLNTYKPSGNWDYD